jgi:hypothetical protein
MQNLLLKNNLHKLRRRDCDRFTAGFIFYLYFPVAHNNTLYLELAHGGHQGFYEGGLICPNPITWLERDLVSLVGSLALVNAGTALKTSSGMVQ